MTRVGWWGTGAVALVLLLLAAGLPLLDRALGSGGRPLAPGTSLSLGTERDGVRPVTFTVPSSGWVLNEGRTSLSSNAELSSGGVVLDVRVVVPLASVDARELWQGVARLVAAGGPARLRTHPVPITTASGLTGLTGRLTGPDRTGTAAVFTKRTLGAAVTASGPPDAYGRIAAQVEAMVRTVRIAAP